MAGGRRCPGGRSSARLQVDSVLSSGNNSNINFVSTSGNGAHNEKNKITERISIGRTLAPKHMPTPLVPADGQIYFEAMSFAMSLVIAALQLLTLYNTVWWLPQSYNSYSMNFYLIDPCLLIFIITMMARQLVYAMISKSMNNFIPQRWLPFVQKVFLILIMGVLIWCLYHVHQRHSTIKVFYLCSPYILFYFLMFGCNIGPFFDISSPLPCIKEDRKTKFLLDKPLHNCSLNAPAIRAEVDYLQADFNKRFKNALFASFESVYLCVVAPVIFVPRYLHYDLGWVMMYIFLVWLSKLTVYLTQAYSFTYCDVLHRAALHLGNWRKVDNKYVHIPAQTWNDEVLWPHGSIMRHNKELCRSKGPCTAAEPGNLTHYQFYAMFGNPTVLQCSMLILVLTLLIAEFIIIVHSGAWYRTLTMFFLFMMNCSTLYKLFRNYIVSYKAYNTEKKIHRKAQMMTTYDAQ